MKSIRYLAISSLVAFILLFSSCSMEWGKNVYYGGLGGTVKDSDSDSPVSGVSVYVYTEKSARDNSYSSWLDLFENLGWMFIVIPGLTGNLIPQRNAERYRSIFRQSE